MPKIGAPRKWAFVVARACRKMSTRSENLPSESREYLTKWLGTMSGSSYHERMVKASKSGVSTPESSSFDAEPVDDKNVEVLSRVVSPAPQAKKGQFDPRSTLTEIVETPDVGNPITIPKRVDNTASMVYHGTVRSGQQIYADGRSLVVVGSVNNGAEVLADGDIHVYGSLLGRAVAGLGGSVEAHIFARSFGASLVGVSDAFVAPDDFPDLQRLEGKSAYVRMMRADDVPSELLKSGAEIVDCGNGGSLLLSPM